MEYIFLPYITFNIKVLEGTYDIKVSSAGYPHIFIKNLQINEGNSINIEFTFEPDTTPLY